MADPTIPETADLSKIPKRIKVDRGYFDMTYPTPPKGSLGIYPDSVVPFVRADIHDDLMVAARALVAEIDDIMTFTNLTAAATEARNAAKALIAKTEGGE